MTARLDGPISRLDVYPVLHTIYRHAFTRGAFEPIEFEADLENAAGETIARIERARGAGAPSCENDVDWTFEQAAERAFLTTLDRLPEDKPGDTCRLDPPKTKPHPWDVFEKKPVLEIHPEEKSVSVTYHYIRQDEDTYVDALSLSDAMTYWVAFATDFFEMTPSLETLRFEGRWRGDAVLTITVTKKQFEALFSGLQEEIAAHSGITYGNLTSGKMSEAAAAREQAEFKARTYRGAIKGLPKGSYEIDRRLK
jgi:hypothetical protein